jgi:hypothetical protein
VRTNSLYLIGLIALAVAPLHAQQYWVTTPPDCSSLGTTFGQAVAIKNAAGIATIGYSCSVTGTFVWLAAGGMWGTTIRVAAPASAPVGVDYTFYDKSGQNQSLDSTINNDSSSLASGNDVNFALFANQPAEVELLGLTSDAGTGYSTTAEGSVYATFYCPDATTCANVLPQLLYSALPTDPWSLSVPIAWDDSLSYEWSAEGIDDGSTNVVSFVVYNEETNAATYNIYVYDSDGNLAAQGTTPSIPGFNSVTEQAGTYADLLSNVVSPSLPSGIFKILIDGGSSLSAVEVLQINGTSATTLQVAYDTAPNLTTSSRPVQRQSVKRLRAASTPKTVFHGLPKQNRLR